MNNYGYKGEYFLDGEVVLVRDSENSYWSLDIFRYYKEEDRTTLFVCDNGLWRYCIPYSGNEVLKGETGIPTSKPEVLFDIRMRPGYVIEFGGKSSVVFPTKKLLAIQYQDGEWAFLKSLNPDTITRIRDSCEILGGEVLWQRSKLKPKVLTNAQIEERLKKIKKNY